MVKREKVIKTIEALPESFPLEELFERLIVVHKIEQGLEQSERGEVISHEEAKKRVLKWPQK